MEAILNMKENRMNKQNKIMVSQQSISSGEAEKYGVSGSNFMEKNYIFVKRLTDIVLSVFALVLLSPVFLVITLIYKFNKNDEGPLFYQQIRVGKNHQRFGILKFRSMVVNAESKLKSDPVLYRKYVANNYKLSPDEDPRITKIGKWLRKTSLDEIPQFVNILRGDMSLIGPRPVVPEELKEYQDTDKLLSVKPGAMGLWQAKGRSEIGYPERADIEMEYIDNAGLLFDMNIMLRNFWNIFKSKGAY